MNNPDGYLLMRRAGTVWGLRNAEVLSLSRLRKGLRGEMTGAYRIAVGEGVLVADEILAVVDRLRVTPAAPALRRFWPLATESVEGVAVHGGLPLVVMDPRRPPLVLQEEAVVEGEGDGEIRE